MNLGQLLTHLRVNILRDSSQQVAGSSDYLWTDQTLVDYINEAQDEIARATKCLRDAVTAEICQFTTVNNQEFYQVDDRVISILSVRMAGDQADLARAGHADLDAYIQPSTYFFDPSNLSNLPPGKPLAWTSDEGVYAGDEGSMSAIQLRLYPIPAIPYAGIVGSMRVARLPLTPMVLANPTASPEIPRNYHMKLLDYAAYLALRGADLDVAGGDAMGRAKYFKASFDNWVMNLKQDMQSRMFRPAQWAFGRNGFSYDQY